MNIHCLKAKTLTMDTGFYSIYGFCLCRITLLLAIINEQNALSSAPVISTYFEFYNEIYIEKKIIKNPIK